MCVLSRTKICQTVVQVESCFKIGESLAVVLVKSRSQICPNLVMQVKKI